MPHPILGSAPGSVRPGGAANDGRDVDTDQGLSDREFLDAARSVTPALRNYARRLGNDGASVDDLLQDTLLRAWSARGRFLRGSSFKSWTFTILRNRFLTTRVSGNRAAPWNEIEAERRLVLPADQETGLLLAELEGAIADLPSAQREALDLIGVRGLNYEAAAKLCGVAVGTLKSRVSRARATLVARLFGAVDGDGAALTRIMDGPAHRRLIGSIA